MRRYLLHVHIALQVATADVERYVRRVDDTMKQGQIFGNDIVNLVGDEHLIAVELDLLAVDVHVVLDLWEVEYSRQMERIIDVEVYVEQRLVVLVRIELVIELGVVVFSQVGGFTHPCGIDVVDDVVLIGLHLLAVFPLLLLAKHYLYGQELAVLLKQTADSRVFEIVLEVAAYVQDNVSAAL